MHFTLGDYKASSCPVLRAQHRRKEGSPGCLAEIYPDVAAGKLGVQFTTHLSLDLGLAIRKACYYFCRVPADDKSPKHSNVLY